MKLVFLLIILLPVHIAAQTVPFRKYTPGETIQYKLTTEAYRNGQFSGRTVSVSEHKVIKGPGIISEEIKWLNKITYTTKDTVRQDSVAQAVQPYRVSLSPGGKVGLPKLTIPEMVGEITDLNTFYVAIAPALNAQKLSKKNTLIQNSELRQGHFADGMNILYGTDCMQVTQQLVSTNKNYSVIETKFTPPASLCLSPLIDTIGMMIFDYPNNIQMTIKSTDDKVNLFWGVETFTIISTIDNRNGKIIEASMNNVLTLRMRYNASPDLKSYAVEMPMTIRRVLKLELIK